MFRKLYEKISREEKERINESKRKSEEIRKEIEELDEEEIYRQAWKEHNDGYGRTEVYYDVDEKKVEIVSNLTTGTKIKVDNWILLFTIPQNSIANTPWEWEGDILEEEEYEEAQKMIENGEIDDEFDYIRVKGIDFDERFCEYLLFAGRGDIFDWDNIDEQLRKIEDEEE